MIDYNGGDVQSKGKIEKGIANLILESLNNLVESFQNKETKYTEGI